MAAETGITPTHSKTACSCCTLINSCWAIPSSSPSTITPHTADSHTPKSSTPPPSFCWKGFCCSQYPHSATNCSCASSSILPPTCDCSDAPSAIPANEVAHCSPSPLSTNRQSDPCTKPSWNPAEPTPTSACPGSPKICRQSKHSMPASPPPSVTDPHHGARHCSHHCTNANSGEFNSTQTTSSATRRQSSRNRSVGGSPSRADSSCCCFCRVASEFR